MKSVLMSLILAFSVLGCSSKSKNASGLDERDAQRLEDFEEAMKDLSYENYSSASSRLETLLNEEPISELDLVIMYNSGVALEGMESCQKAAERYRSVARLANKKFDKISALALYRLGFVYSCLGEPQKSVVSFLDARKKIKYLPPEVGTAELPARLAAAYASLGRQKEALHYFNEASGGLKRILAGAKRQDSDIDLAAKTLLAMGKISSTPHLHPVLFVRMLSMQQPFLLQAAELKSSKVSRKAMEDLIRAYKEILSFRVPSDLQKEFYVESLKTTRQLQKLRLPSTKEYTKDLFKVVDRTEGLLENRLTQLSKGLSKTPEQKKRESLKREGKIVGE
ncbi:hypothetical protein GW916_11400 [bacterium]|nr:hypothetical protein [bacterium]